MTSPARPPNYRDALAIRRAECLVNKALRLLGYADTSLEKAVLPHLLVARGQVQQAVDTTQRLSHRLQNAARSTPIESR